MQNFRILRFVRNVFANPILSGVIDPDDNQRANFLSRNQPCRSLADLPVDASKRGRRVKQILAVVEIQDGIKRRARRLVIGRQPNTHQAGVPKETAAEFVYPQVPDLDRGSCDSVSFSSGYTR